MTTGSSATTSTQLLNLDLDQSFLTNAVTIDPDLYLPAEIVYSCSSLFELPKRDDSYGPWFDDRYRTAVRLSAVFAGRLIRNAEPQMERTYCWRERARLVLMRSN